MSGIKSYQMSLYGQADAEKKFIFKQDGSTGFISHYKEAPSGLPAERTHYDINAGGKLIVDGIGNVASFTTENRNKGLSNEADIASEVVNRGVAVASANSAISAEQVRAQNAEQANATLIGQNEASQVAKNASQDATHTAYVTSSTASLNAEIARAQGVEGVNATAISANGVAIANEATRAQGIEAVNAQATADEKARALVAESALGNATSAETARAMAKEASIDAVIANLLSNTDPASLDSLSELITSYQAGDNSLNVRITTLEQIVAQLLTLHA